MTNALLKIQSADEAEAVFYESFTHCDMAVMAALWAEGEVVCVHPGSGIIYGREKVVQSWRHILQKSTAPQLRYTTVERTTGKDLAVHTVVEEFLDGDIILATVVATNVYRKFDQSWLMVKHHGSLVHQQRDGETLQ